MQSLADFCADFERRARDIVEDNARGAGAKDIEATWRRLADLRAKLVHLQTGVEEVLLPYMTDAKLRELVRGTQEGKS